MQLKTGQGASITTTPTLITVVTAATYQQGPSEVKASYEVSAVEGDVLTVAIADGYTDRNFSVNDYVDCRPEKKFIVDLNTQSNVNAAAIAAIDEALNSIPSGPLKGVAGVLQQAIAGTDYQAPIELTTTGSSGAATLIENVLNIPQYSGGTTPGGGSGALQYNSAGNFGGSTNLGYDSTNTCLLLTPMGDPGSPAAGDLWASTVSGGLAYARGAGLIQRPGGPIFACGAGSAIANTTTQTSIFVGTTALYGSRTIPANTLQAGDVLVMRLTGLRTTAASAPFLSLNAFLGTTDVIRGGNTCTASSTSVDMLLEFHIHVLSVGSSGTCTGAFYLVGNTGGYGGSNTGSFVGTALTLGTPATINTTTALTFDFQLFWSAASPSNSWQLLNASLWLL
jgi:hypothetical protein